MTSVADSRIVSFTLGVEKTGGKVYEVTVRQAKQSKLIESMLADDDDDDEVREIPLPNITSEEVMDKIIAFMRYHENNPMKTISKPITTNELSAIVGDWDADFAKLDDNRPLLFSLILGANYLDMPDLLDLTICKIATMIRGKEPEQVKALFNIPGPEITPEEEQQVRDSNPWIFNIDLPKTTAE